MKSLFAFLAIMILVFSWLAHDAEKQAKAAWEERNARHAEIMRLIDL